MNMSIVIFTNVKYVILIVTYLYNWVMDDKLKGKEDKKKANEQYMHDNFQESYVLNRYEGRYETRELSQQPVSNQIRLGPVNMIQKSNLLYNRVLGWGKLHELGIRPPYEERLYLRMI